MELSEKIQLARKKKALSQEDLANLLNVSRQAVQKWESGATQPEISKLVAISNILDVSLDWLLKDIEQKEEAKIEKQETSTSTSSNKKISARKLKAIKAWLIVGCILTPISYGSSLVSLGYYSLIALAFYGVTIPVCVNAIKRCRNAHSRSELIGFGVVSLIFVSMIGGILMLAVSDNDFIDSDQPVTNERVKTQIKESKKIDSNDLLKKKAKSYLLKREKRVGYLKDSEKQNILVELLKQKENEIEKINSEDVYQDFLVSVDKICEEVNKIYSKRISIIVLVSLVASLVIGLSIGIPIGVSKKQERQRKYKKLYDLVYNYETDCVDQFDYNSEISDLIRDLEGHYNLSVIKKEYDNASNYYKLKKEIKYYDGEQTTNKKIDTYLLYISKSYKLRDQIENDFYYVQSYVGTITFGKYNVLKNVTDQQASANRDTIKYLYSYANDSGLWNFDKVVKRVAIPYLTDGARFTCGSYYFEKKTVDSEDHLYRDIPLPSSYDTSKEYYFDITYNSSENSLKYYAILKTNTKIHIDLFRINSVTYNESNRRFVCSVYLYGNGTTQNFSN